MTDPIVDLVLKIKPSLEVKYDKQSLLKWYIQKAVELTRKEIMSQFTETVFKQKDCFYEITTRK